MNRHEIRRHLSLGLPIQVNGVMTNHFDIEKKYSLTKEKAIIWLHRYWCDHN
jgi:predicted proteasome-type protease